MGSADVWALLPTQGFYPVVQDKGKRKEEVTLEYLALDAHVCTRREEAHEQTARHYYPLPMDRPRLQQ